MTIKSRYNAAAAAGNAAAIEALLREVVVKARGPDPIAPPTSIGRIDSKLAALLAEVDDDASDETVLSTLDERHRETIDRAAEAIAEEPVRAALDAVRIAQYHVDAIARRHDATLAKIADELSCGDLGADRRSEADKRYDAVLLERENEIDTQRVTAVESVVVERAKVADHRAVLEATMANGSDDPLVLIAARDKAAAMVAARLKTIDGLLLAATFVTPTPADPINALTGDSAEKQRRLEILWAEETGAKHTGTNWMRFADETPQTQWVVPYVIPLGAVTILSGEGGVGKSRLALQLAAAASLRTGLWTHDWVPAINEDSESIPVQRTHRPFTVLVVNAEDQLSDAARRIVQIREGIAQARGDGKLPPERMGTELAAGMSRISYYQARGAIWGPAEGGSTHIETTAELTDVGRDVRAQCERVGVRMLILDPLANLYASSEITRSHVAAFMRSWNAWAQRTGLAVVLLAHPPKSGAAFSGSSSWPGASRSAIEFKRVARACMVDGQLMDAAEKAAQDQSQKPETATLYQLSVSKINQARPQAYWLAESGLAFVTGRDQDLFDLASQSQSTNGGMSSDRTSEPTEPSFMDDTR